MDVGPVKAEGDTASVPGLILHGLVPANLTRLQVHNQSQTLTRGRVHNSVPTSHQRACIQLSLNLSPEGVHTTQSQPLTRGRAQNSVSTSHLRACTQLSLNLSPDVFTHKPVSTSNQRECSESIYLYGGIAWYFLTVIVCLSFLN